ncbi:MAG: putative lipid II flippase FtsW [Candidatus Aminicenantes bacterium]|nr:putative lipid II flippase FtsW [Candidatus Aminicenantes bacterium]
MKNREIFRRGSFDRPLFIITLLLFVIGLIMIFSASALMAAEKYHQPFHFLIEQVKGAIIGFALLLIIMMTKRDIFRWSAFVLSLLILCFVLLSLCFLMPPISGANRWVKLFGMSFQPSELTKISLILFIAFYLEKKKDHLNEVKTILPLMAVIGLSALLILSEPDVGTAVLILFISFLLLFIGGTKFRYLVAASVLALSFFLLYFLHLPKEDYRRQRWEAFLAPEEHRERAAFQILQSKLAIGSGGFLGVGLGESTRKLYFLPCAQTDFIYAVIGEEFGLLGTISVLVLYLLFFWRGWKIAQKATSLSYQLASYGLTLMICCQALLNISIVLALGPTKGVPLPFISYGRSALVCNLVAVGLLLNISQRKVNNLVIK